ncbi:NAD(P)/FAD-dependent oxidoreductase [Flavihumibacter petaseus]|uniref:Putative oxidoreductase n=1 Tax=Flavihumibacter petaseus NBRC 106054 TaxID=1220578 RepID=A0A0E9MXH3_9BACT|nr:FAD-dependent oxidoreductase [Flavihumibacter petaseus]GAO42121.1 putative oxidoreductase [Flavihumibacter petaseus NBRC 106054]
MKAVVVGGGIIGLSSAYFLKEAGWDVVVVDRSDLSDNCSYGNLGMIVPSHFVPLAAPGMVTQGIRWMFNSKSPFYVRPSLSSTLIQWGLKFMRSATAAHVEASAVPLRDLNVLSKKLYEAMAAKPEFAFALEKKGIMMYFRDEKVAEEEIHLAEKARSLGLDVAALSAGEARQIETGTRLDVLGAVHYRCDAHLYPNLLMPQLVKFLKGAGVQFITNAPVLSVNRQKNQVRSIVAGNQTIDGDVFVFAAGSWLPELGRRAGLQLSVLPGKGYSFTLQQPETTLQVPAILCEARVAITPMDGKMRYGGTMELGAINDKINMRRVQGIVESVPDYFPDIKLQMPKQEDIWFGYRPCTPDGLPLIGYTKTVDNLIVAGGHAMMGLSLGPATGKLVAEMAGGVPLTVNATAFRPDRF